MRRSSCYCARPWVTFLGAGPNEATARFGAAKLLEGPQVLGVSTNVEEWAHEEYFVTDAGAPVVVVSPSGAGHSRTEEILSEIAFIGARAILVSDQRRSQRGSRTADHRHGAGGVLPHPVRLAAESARLSSRRCFRQAQLQLQFRAGPVRALRNHPSGNDWGARMKSAPFRAPEHVPPSTDRRL